MKKTVFTPFFILSMIVLLAAGCRQAEIEDPSVADHVLIGLLERGAETRTHFGEPVDGIYYPYWTAEDALAVYADGLSYVDKYTLTDGAGTEKGSFAGRVSGKSYVALYPYSDRVREGLQGNVLHLQLPSEQIYKPSSIGEGAFPMIAVGGEEGLSFKNLCSVLKISLTGNAGVKAVRFIAHDDKMAVCGPATVRTDFDAVPELVMGEEGLPVMTLVCNGLPLLEDKATDFMLVIPSGTYKGGFSIEVETFSGTFTRSIDSDVTFGRSQFRFIAPFRCDPDGEIDPDDIPYDQIWYVSDDGDIYEPLADAFDRNIVSNTYSDGKGIIVFDGPLTKVGEDAFVDSHITESIFPTRSSRSVIMLSTIHSLSLSIPPTT